MAPRKPKPGQSLAEKRPNLTKDWSVKNEFGPEDVSYGSSIKAWWICPLGHEFIAKPTDRFRGSGCPYCCNKQILPGFNDLSTSKPELVKEWSTKNTISPYEVSCWSNKKVWWICELGHEWVSVISDRSSGKGCPYCSNRKILAGFNDLATTDPGLIIYWSDRNDLKPTEVSRSSGRKVEWVCDIGHKWESSVARRTAGGGCPQCQTNLRTENTLRELLKSRIGQSRQRKLDGLRWPSGQRFEVDYISECGLVVEYDGYLWHKSNSSMSRDLYKTEKLMVNGYKVVRLRHRPLELLRLENESLLQIQLDWDAKGNHIETALDTLVIPWYNGIKTAKLPGEPNDQSENN